MESFEVLPLYRALVSNAQDILGVLNTRGMIAYLSPATQRILRRNPEHLQGLHWVDLVHPDDRGDFRDWLESCQEAESFVPLQLRVGAPGHWRHLAMSGLQIAEDQHTFRIIFSARDATHEVIATQALEEREARFRSAFDDAPIGKALLDQSGCIIDANKKLAEILDRWETEIAGQGFCEMFAESEGGAALAEHWQKHGDWSTTETELGFLRGAERRYLRVHFAPVRVVGTAYALAQVEDFSARMEAEQALVRSLHSVRQGNRQLQKLAWMASHDLKEPLRGLSGSLQLILRRHGEALSDAEREAATEAVAQAKALRGRLDELETTVDAARHAPDAKLLSFAEVVQPWIEARADRTLQVQHEDLPSLRADPDLGPCLLELLEDLAGASAGSVAEPASLQLQGRWESGGWEIRILYGPVQPDYEAGQRLLPGGALFSVYRRFGELGADLSVAENCGEQRQLLLGLPAG